MVTYTGKPSVLAEALEPYHSQGFELDEKDDHVVQLAYNGNVIAVFNQMVTTVKEIREACREHLEKGEGNG